MSFRLSRSAAAIAMLVAVSSDGRADDYPFTGLFVFPENDAAPADAQLVCAYNFFSQGADGTFINYHLDLPLYRKDGTIRFLVYTRGHCTIEGGKLEVCTTNWDSEKDNIGYVGFDVIRGMMPEVVSVSYFDSLDDARSFITGGTPAPTSNGVFRRCPFDDAKIAKYRTNDDSGIVGDARTNMVTPKLDDETRSTMTAVLAAIDAGK